MAKTLTIAGVNYLPYYKSNSAVIRETLRKTNVMNLNIVTKGIATAPQEGSEVLFKDDTRFLFGGYISRVQPEETGKGSLFDFSVEVSDYSYIFNSKIARRAYTNKTLLYIVTDLMNTYVGTAYSFDLTNVQTGPTIDTISFDHISIRKCFEKLSKLTGYVWWVDYEKKLYFQTVTTTAAPETVTDSSNNIDSVNITYDTSQVRNSVTVIGSANGEQSLDLTSDTFVGDNETRSWELSDKPSQVLSITINGVSQQFSLDLNERETDVFVYSFTSQSLRLTDTQTTPTGSDTIVITYYPRIPIIEKLTDLASISFFTALDGGNGTYEYTVRDSSIGSISEANARAKQELEEYSMPLADGKITTRTGLLTAGSIFKPGQALTVNLPTQGLSTDTVFMIQEVQIQVLDGSTPEYLYTIRFGGKIVGIQEFLESLASQQTEGEVSNEDEILTIENVSDVLDMSDSDVAPTTLIETPPYHYTSGSPVGKWNLSEWS